MSFSILNDQAFLIGLIIDSIPDSLFSIIVPFITIGIRCFCIESRPTA